MILRSWAMLVVTALTCGCLRIETTVRVDSDSDASPSVAFDVPIPSAPEELPAYNLRPTPLKNGLLARLGLQTICAEALDPKPTVDAKATMSTSAGPTAVSGPTAGPPVLARGVRRCEVDEETGDVEVFPDFAQLLEHNAKLGRDRPSTREQAFHSAVELLQISDRLSEPLAPDGLAQDTKVEGQQFVVHHQQATRPDAHSIGGTTVAPQEDVLFYVVQQRRIAGYAVDGPGSRQAIGLDGTGTPQAFTRRWRPIDGSRVVKARYTPEQVRSEIERQVLATKPRTSVHVRKVELVYYDGNAEILQPVYRYVVEESPGRMTLGAPQHSFGYVAFAETSESVPELGSAAKTQALTNQLDGLVRGAEVSPHRVSVGVYVTRADSNDWANDAYGFLSALKSGRYAADFDVQPPVHAYPYMFADTHAQYANGVNLALVEAHGAHGVFATYSDCCEPVVLGRRLPGFPAPVSFGGKLPGGKLEHLALHSCNVVTSPAEEASWALPWWNVFQGLSTVVGYHTAMYIDDGAGAAFGHNLAAGAPVLAAWFGAVATLSAYVQDPSLSFLCDGAHPMGRASAITACGAANARMGEVSRSADLETCLDAWWMGESTSAQ